MTRVYLLPNQHFQEENAMEWRLAYGLDPARNHTSSSGTSFDELNILLLVRKEAFGPGPTRFKVLLFISILDPL